MKKVFIFCILLIGITLAARADHITGGEMYYTYTPVNNMYKYDFTMKLFMRCHSNRQFNNPTIVSIFDRVTNARIANVNVSLASSQTISINTPDPCITNPPEVCYVVGYYTFSVTLPPSVNGYLLSSQVNYRIAGISNLETGYNNVGATYTAEIPGTGSVITGPENNSAHFVGSDLVVVCANNRFSYSFAAEDRDGDGLRYSLCDAYRSGSGGNTVVPPPNPPYAPVPYGNGYFGNTPLGPDVSINPTTGLITGIAPSPGIYVITVCVDEIRNGKVIATQRKDLQINIAPCNIAAAILPPEYMLCADTRTLQLKNLSSSPLIRTQLWKINNRARQTVFTSTDVAPTYNFTDTGLYTIRLIINPGEACTDSTEALARVYPGFVPDFSFAGICFTKPTTFTDKTTTVYGRVNSWSWTLGSDSRASEQNPVYTFPGIGDRNVQLIVSNNNGCIDTVVKTVGIVSSPPLNLAFTDTLICIGDPLILKAQATGSFSWTPTDNMTNANTATPTVSPAVNTTYHVQLNDNGCINNATVQVRVTDHVNLQVMNDTTICKGDTVQMRIVSDAFKYSWVPAEQFINPYEANAIAVTAEKTNYTVTANIGSCVATAQVVVSTVPYPKAYAGKDTSICFDSFAQLHGAVDGSSLSWFPTNTLDNATTLNPIATPATTTRYILSAYDSDGCPKRGTDTVIVTVLPQIAAQAGTDTSVIVKQPLQLHASGGTIYNWTPSFGLSDANIADPVAVFNEPNNGIRYKVVISNEAGCADSSFIKVRVFNTAPSIFVPTAFTPNADGKNDVLRPIAAGIKQFEFFHVYNRWGQLVYATTISGEGWDGTINGNPQASGTYVWMVKAVDYNNTTYFNKGTVTLIK